MVAMESGIHGDLVVGPAQLLVSCQLERGREIAICLYLLQMVQAVNQDWVPLHGPYSANHCLWVLKFFLMCTRIRNQYDITQLFNIVSHQGKWFCFALQPCGTSTSSPTTTALTCPRNRVSCPAGCCRQRRQNNQRQRQGRRQGQRRGQRQGQRRRQGLGQAQGQSRRQPVNRRGNQVRAG